MKPRRWSLVGDDNDLPELGARLESGKRGGRVGESMLRVDERMDARLLEERAEAVELDDRPHRGADDRELPPEHPREIGGRIGTRRGAGDDDRTARAQRLERVIP